MRHQRFGALRFCRMAKIASDNLGKILTKKIELNFVAVKKCEVFELKPRNNHAALSLSWKSLTRTQGILPNLVPGLARIVKTITPYHVV